MSDRAEQLAAAWLAVLREQMRGSDAVRTLLTELAQSVLDEAARIEGTARDAGDAEVQGGGAREAETGSETSQAETDDARVVDEHGTVTLAIGDGAATVQVRGSRADLEAAERSLAGERGPARQDGGERDTPASIDLGLIATRCALKAASCLMAIERRDSAADPERERAAIERMNAMIAKAKALPDCFLWAFWPHEVQPSDERLRTICACYEALGEAATLVSRCVAPDSPAAEDDLQAAFQAFAEASSALRVALGWTWLTSADRDQDDAHLWLRRETNNRQIFIERHMRLGDEADPARAGELLDEVRTLAALLDERARATKQIDTLINRIRYHARNLPEGEGERGGEHDCRRINEACDRLRDLGVRPSDRRMAPVRAMLRVDAFPDSEPANTAVRAFASVGVPQAAKAEGPADRGWSDRVLEVRGLLGGGSAVVIGGEARPDAIERIREAFGLDKVEWVSLTEHGTGEPMKAPIFRAETRLVLVLIRLAGHLHVDEARAYAREAGKPCVLLPAGYNPEQIAERVLTQAAEQLG